MSTNLKMVIDVYASGGSVEGCFVPTPEHKDKNGSTQMGINLPVCGIVVEVDTKDLEIREPEIIPSLQGHYNNGFPGYEWIADEIPPENYKVKKLVLSRFPNDRNRITIDVEGLDDEGLQKAIEKVQKGFEKAKMDAMRYKAFLDTIDDQRLRLNSNYLQRMWDRYQIDNPINDV